MKRNKTKENLKRIKQKSGKFCYFNDMFMASAKVLYMFL